MGTTEESGDIKYKNKLVVHGVLRVIKIINLWVPSTGVIGLKGDHRRNKDLGIKGS